MVVVVVVVGLFVVVLVVNDDVVFILSSFFFDEKLTDVGAVNSDLVDPSVVKGCVVVVVVVVVVSGAFVVVEIFSIIFLYLLGSNNSIYARFSGVVVGRVVVVVGVGVVVDNLVVGAEVGEAVFSILGVKSFPKVVFLSFIRFIISILRNSKNPRVVAGVVGVFAAKVLVEMLGIVVFEVCSDCVVEGAISSTDPLNFLGL